MPTAIRTNLVLQASHLKTKGEKTHSAPALEAGVSCAD